MTRCRASGRLAFGLALMGVVLAGCGLDEGRPWGEVTLKLEAAFEPGASRVEAGRLKTALDYRVAISSIDVEVASVAMTALVDGAAAFDPGNPPDGYSLCHNGHCHSADGRLVDYEDIAAELAGAGDAPALISVSGGVAELGLGSREVIGLSACDEVACEVTEPSVVGLVAVEVVSLSISGVAYDARTGEAQRLEGAGVEFAIVWSAEGVAGNAVRVAVEGGWRFGPGESLGLDVAATLALPASLLDGVEFASGDEATFGLKVAAAVGEDGALVVEGRRFE